MMNHSLGVTPPFETHIYKTLIISLCLFINVPISTLQAQDLANVGNVKEIKFSGGLNFATEFYSVSGIPARRSPFSWSISGSPTLKIGDMSFPFSFSFRNQKFGYGTPFNKIGVSPYYKWAKLHIGYRSMRFSNYSMSGRTFLGVGAEIKPGKFRASAFTGTLRNPLAQRDTVVYGTVLIPTYKRKAYGFKVGYGSTKNYFDLIYFKAKDDITSIPTSPEEVADVELDPVENLVLGTAFKFTLFRKFSLTSNVSASAYADNTTYNELNLSNGTYRFFDKFFDPNISTQVSLAGDINALLNLKSMNFGVKYRRVEPHYRSLGISYIQSDVESVTGSMGLNMIKRKLQLNGQFGVERTNLRNYDFLGRRRIIGSLRAQFVPNQEIMVMGQYSNYQYETQDGLVELNDTLRFVSVTSNSGLFVNFNKQKDNLKYGFNANIQMQSIKDQSPIQALAADIGSLQAGLSLKFEWASTQLRFTPSINYSNYNYLNRKQERYGLGMNVRKSFLDDKVELSVYSRYAYNDINKLRNGVVWTNRAKIGLKISDIHAIQWSSTWMQKTAIVNPSYNEFRSRISYGLRF